MMKNDQWQELAEEHEMAYFRTDVCLGSPQSFSLAEKKQICADMEASAEAIDTAMRADFEALPPEAQARLLEMLCASGVESESFWKTIPIG